MLYVINYMVIYRTWRNIYRTHELGIRINTKRRLRR